MHEARSLLRIYSMEGEVVEDIDLPAIGSAGRIRGEREDTEMFYSFSSFLYPSTVFRYDFATGRNSVFRIASTTWTSSIRNIRSSMERWSSS